MPQPVPETLYALGLPRWRLRARAGSGAGEVAQAADSVAATTREESAPATSAGGVDVVETLEALRAEVAGCQACALAGDRTQTVFGNGNPRARWMFIGEAPGRDEDARGEPFVGKAGRLLGAMLNALGLTRDEVYVANVVKCRPPHNRDPEAAERAACRGYLDAQIRAVKPELLIALGRVAAASLLETDAALGTLRGRIHALPGSELPVVVTYHPAYLLRQPVHKARVWEDLLRARQLVAPQVV